MSRHPDKEVDRAFIQLSDALVTWERNTGRGSKLFFIPDYLDDDIEDIIFLMDGKPVDEHRIIVASQLDLAKRKVLNEE